MGELRFGREEGVGPTRRLRWLHVGCAAETVPDALQMALELGGWQAVPKEDHYDLRRLMGDARDRELANQRPLDASRPDHHEVGSLWSPSWLRGLWRRRATNVAWTTPSRGSLPRDSVRRPSASSEPVPRPPTGLGTELDRAWVFADALQNSGDPRGELLALELAAEVADSQPARALRASARAAWLSLAVPGGPRASAALHLRWRGGFLLGARSRGGTGIRGLLASPAARTLTRVRIEFCTQEEFARLVAGVVAHRAPLTRLDLPDSRTSDLSGLSRIEGLRALRVGDRFDPAVLERLPELRGLALGGRVQSRVRELAGASRLELLELVGPKPTDLEGLARHLPHLRDLTVTKMSASEGARCLAGSERLERLRLPDTPVRSFAELPSLPRLRALSLVPGNLPLIRELSRLSGLERLALIGGKVGELESIAGLERLEHLALSATRVTDLAPLAQLPRLHRLILDGGDLRRTSGLDELVGLEHLELLRMANLDLAILTRLPNLRSLRLELGGRRPRGLESLEQMTELRELTIPQSLIEDLDPLDRTLARIEVLTLEGGEQPPRAKLIAVLPNLRRLILPDHDPGALARLADQLAEVAIEGDPPVRDLLGLLDAFDWRAVGWPDGLDGARSERGPVLAP